MMSARMQGDLLRRMFPGQSEMAQRMRDFDWTAHALGTPDTWPVALRTAVGICLSSHVSMHVCWGPDLILFYNDAFIRLLGPGEHPRVLAHPGADVIGRVTCSSSPILGDDGNVDGMFGTIETPETVERAATRAKDDFLSLLGHELRNPLSTLTTTLQTLAIKNPSPEAARMERAVWQLTRLVDDLLDMSRLARGKVELSRAHVEIALVVDRAMERVRPVLEERETHVFTRVARSGLAVNCDLERIAQVLMNALANASKFSEPGANVSLEASRIGDRLRITIVDSGSGIAPGKLPKVFDAFGDPDSTNGLGVGLAIARNLIELHEGYIAVTSDGIGRGTTCAIELPCETEIAGKKPIAKQRKKRVLLVEDNHDTAIALQRALEQLGYQVALAHNGPVALTVARSFLPDVALLDIGLPVMDGWELARRLRELRVPSHQLHIVAVTARDGDSDKQRSVDAGFAEHLVKPIDLAKLERVVETLPDPLVR